MSEIREARLKKASSIVSKGFPSYAESFKISHNTEFSLLELLFDEPGKVVPRAEILEQLWGYPPRRSADLRVVDVYVARLRGKLEPDPRNPELILTVRGIGYASQRVGETATSLASWASVWYFY